MIQRQALVQEQRFRLSPQLYQSLKVMELPAFELREKIEEEIGKNPALEVLADHTAASPERFRREYGEYRQNSASAFQKSGVDEKRRFLEGAVSRPETLQEHLLRQLALEASGAVRRIGEQLIQNLDEDGFHKEPVDLLLEGESKSNVEAALALVQSLDPAGTCTSGYLESLKVQAALLPGAPPYMAAALDRLAALERGKFAETARELGRSAEEIRLCFQRIKDKLFPFPGRRFAVRETRYVAPDVQVIRRDGEFAIILNHEAIPVLGINPFFMKIAGEKDKNARDFVRENIREARWFIDSINQRNHTLLRVSRAIVAFQRAFFDRGPKYLAPLTLKDIAGELGIHEATVSRTANSKYMQTEWGIYELRHFFTNSISGTGSGGSRYSKEGVKEIIKEIVRGEKRRLSDKELAELLGRRGISLARRTVAKYRNELDLGSLYGR